jgi:hypothetical protein
MKTLIVLVSLLATFTTSAHADQFGNDFGRGGPGRGRPAQDLCSGTYFGSYSNGKSAVFSFVRTGFNSVNVNVQLGGREVYTAVGSCDQRGNQAQFVFQLTNAAPIVHRGMISDFGGRASIQGAQDGGFQFSLSR